MVNIQLEPHRGPLLLILSLAHTKALLSAPPSVVLLAACIAHNFQLGETKLCVGELNELTLPGCGQTMICVTCYTDQNYFDHFNFIEVNISALAQLLYVG